MKRSEINSLIRSAQSCFQAHEWALPPRPHWDVTDFGLGDWRQFGLVLVNLAEEPEYCEKLMYARKDMTTPAHCHRKKKEDIICRWGRLAVQVWDGVPDESRGIAFSMPIDHEPVTVKSGQIIELSAGSRVTLVPGVYHAFYPLGDECIIGEVSTANDDLNDNIFVNPDIGRYPDLEEDEPALLRLLSDKSA
ncbi:MAG: D-lyxose/D-mannose family sugar isomerase [Verrucomicrobia bacterium]|nr:D-lyxose/D-mannose family sugar isomerase [Verrucomicrobiota bacterium]